MDLLVADTMSKKGTRTIYSYIWYKTILERFKLKLSENGIYFKANALN